MSVGNALRKFLLIGWDAADWKIIHKLVDEGKMPNMGRFIDEGVIGNLATIFPELSPMLWTSIATGKRPFRHGILGFTEPDPERGGIRPITNISRKSKAIWNILNQCGKKSIVVGWWPSHPAEPINGVMVSNHYQRAVAPFGKEWPMRPGTVHPKRLVRNLADLRLHPQELDPDLVMNFIPLLAEIDQEKDHRIEGLAKIIADCTTVNRAATAIMHFEPWDFAAVYYDAIDHFCHGFMNYHPPKLPWVPDRDFELFQHIVEGGYIYHDILLGELLKEAGEDAVVMIVSDHGFHSDHLRPADIPSEPAGPFIQHRPFGIFAVKGPGIRRDELIYGASLLDICPTILHLFGLPVGQDMDGKPLTAVALEPREVSSIPSWEDVAGEDGSHPAGSRIAPVDAEEAIQQLIALGYIEKPDEDREKAVRDCIRELDYNLARSYMDAGGYEEAVPVLESLLRNWPDESRFGIQLVSCYQELDRNDLARAALETLIVRKEGSTVKAKEELKDFLAARGDSVAGEWPEKDRSRLRQLRAAATLNPFALEYLRGSLLLGEGRPEDALIHLKKAEDAEPNAPHLHKRLGDAYLSMKQLQNAQRSYSKAIEIDPENAAARLGLARTFLKRRQNGRAAEEALAAVGLLYHNPLAHYVLGAALHRMGRISEAVQALRIAVTQNPFFPAAHRRLSAIHRKHTGDIEAAEIHSSLAKSANDKMRLAQAGNGRISHQESAPLSVTAGQVPFPQPAAMQPFDPSHTAVVVSGLPRCGTSMMMQMLAAGGIPPLTDGIRAADEDNQRGYFEYEKSKRLRTEKKWIEEAVGKAVKIVSHLITELPNIEGLSYRIVFMERDLGEAVRSQRAMLARQGEKGTRLTDDNLKRIFTRQLDHIKRAIAVRKIPVLFVDYKAAVSDPTGTAARLNDFFSGQLDCGRMAAAVEHSLYRQRG